MAVVFGGVVLTVFGLMEYGVWSWWSVVVGGGTGDGSWCGVHAGGGGGWAGERGDGSAREYPGQLL